MSMLTDNNEFEKYVELCDNKYLAAMFVAEKARHLAEKYHNVINHSEALHWVLSGEIPENIFKHDEIIRRRKQKSLGSAREYLSNVLDEPVRKSVLTSLKLSKKAGHLIYYYEGVYEPDRKARIRILVNKFWHES